MDPDWRMQAIDPVEWAPWFAWYPVRASRWVWLVTVKRRDSLSGWEYKTDTS